MRVSTPDRPARLSRLILVFLATATLLLAATPAYAQGSVEPDPTATVAPGDPDDQRPGDRTVDLADPTAGSAGDARRVEGFGATAKAAAVVGFVPGNIISDAVFRNKNAMSEAQIRSFIDGRVAACQAGYTCLESFRQSTATKPANAQCAQYTGAANEDAATIIFKVSRACGINPQVLLVMLQKEQGLVTHVWPSQFRYDKAMGYMCPDTAPCDPKYFGFQNQVYGAAWQLNRYDDGDFTRFKPGGVRSVGFHPNASCGASNVYIWNQSTANLYYYTPYQPNAAALAAGTGTGDSCSSYGNRNFYTFFKSWFGSTGGGAIATPGTADPQRSAAVYRFWSPKFANAHFYTVSTAEAQNLKSTDRNWTYEGTDFRVWPLANGVCPAGTTPVYRFWSSAFASHFYTISSAEAEKINSGDKNWKFESVAFCTATSGTGKVPVHRFWSPVFKKHFYTANAKEASTIRNTDKNWTYEGIALYASPSGPAAPSLR